MDTSGIVHAKYISNPEDFDDEYISDDEPMANADIFEKSPLSPDTNEFLVLERQVELEDRYQRVSPRTSYLNSSGDYQPLPIARSTSINERTILDPEQLEHHKQLLQSELESKLEERKRSIDASEQNVDEEGAQLQMLERRPFRSFSRADEYLYAIKEDLAEWLNMLYPGVDMDADNFMTRLETGELLVKHANAVRQKAIDLMEKISAGLTRQKPPNFTVPDRELPCRYDVQAGTWFARDNVFNFIKFCRTFGVMECVMFETEDLVCRKNEKHVILTLLEVARRGARLGMLAPMIVQFEQEIDREIAREEKERRREEKEEERRQKEDERRQKEEERRRREEEKRRKEEEELCLKLERESMADGLDSLQVEVDDSHMRLDDVEYIDDPEEDLEDEEGDEDDDDDVDDDEEEDEEEEDEDYAFPIGPLPQNITNDLKSLDEMVRELVSDCQCPTQFPMIRVAEGKYRIGDTQVLIFVRILRNHVMVRVGGGWDTLQHYLDKHDPCRCKAGHRGTAGAHITMRSGGRGLMNVCYDRNELIFAFRKTSEPVYRIDHYEIRVDSPGTRRRSSANVTSSAGRRSSSQNPDSKPVYMFQNPLTSTPRGSITNIAQRGRSSSTTPSFVHKMSSNTTTPMQPKTSTGRSEIAPPGFILGNRSKSPSRDNNNESHDFLDGAKSHPNLVYKCDGSGTKSHLLCVDSNKKSARDTLSTCDSGSEVSDEGYKSSQGGCNSTGTNASDLLHLDAKKVDENGLDSNNDRPDSSLTVTSECSSTISSEEDPADVTIHRGNQCEPPQALDLPPASPTRSSISDEMNWPPPPPPIASTPVIANDSTSPSKSNRLSTLFSNMKIPKLKFNRKHQASTQKGGSSDSDDGDKKLPTGVVISPTRSEACVEKNPQQRFSRSMSVGSEDGGLLGNFSRSGGERRSYRAPTATSRYMQAAEAYAARKRSDKSGCSSPTGSGASSSRHGTWSSSTLGRKGRERSALSQNTFQPPSRAPSRTGVSSRPSSRTASASPGPSRKRTPSGGSYSQPRSYEQEIYLNKNLKQELPTSTHSTPARKPGRNPTESSSLNKSVMGYREPSRRAMNGNAKTSKSSHALADIDTGENDESLKKMEEILLIYKARVENHLAAEGRQLPKEIFEDFTTQWVATCKSPSTVSTPTVAKSVSNGNLLMRESSQSKISVTPRRDPLKGQDKKSRIPKPTFFNSSVASEANI